MFKNSIAKIIEGFQEPTWEDCYSISVKSYDSEEEKIMKMWDTWREYIKNGGTASWPRDEFEMLVDGYEDKLKESEAERERFSKLLIEARIEIVRLEEGIKEYLSGWDREGPNWNIDFLENLLVKKRVWS